MLESDGILMYLSGTCKTACEAIEQFKAGKLATIYAPTSAGAPEPAGASSHTSGAPRHLAAGGMVDI